MKRTLKQVKALAAGSMATAAVVAVLAPLNMGGCGGGDIGASLGGAVGSIASGGKGALGGGGVSTGELITRGVGVGKNILEALSLNEDDERAMGQSVALEATSRYGVTNDRELTKYVTLVAQTLADGTTKGGRPVVAVLNTSDVNAYSGPSGYIMITRGLLDQLQDESELAGVLAHEMGHVIEQHGFKLVRDDKLGQAVVGAATINQRETALLGFGKNLAGNVLGSPYNQGQENEADADAVRIMAAAGYDPQGYVRALQRLAALQTSGGANRAFSTHPALADRIRSVSNQIQRENLAGGQTNQPRYAATVIRGRA